MLSARNPSQTAELKSEIANSLRTHRDGHQLLRQFVASATPDPPERNWLLISFLEALKKSIEARAEGSVRK
jgi:hypothetical protein